MTTTVNSLVPWLIDENGLIVGYIDQNNVERDFSGNAIPAETTPRPSIAGQGPQGVQGPPGPVGPAGTGLNTTGAYNNATTYHIGPPPDMVTQNGSGFLCGVDGTVGISPQIAITSMTATYNAGVYTIAVVLAAASTVTAIGNSIPINGATNGGTGGDGLVNSVNFTVSAFTDSQHFSFQVTAASGAIGTINTSKAWLTQATNWTSLVLQGAPGPQGAQGPIGQQGPAGAPGAAGSGNILGQSGAQHSFTGSTTTTVVQQVKVAGGSMTLNGSVRGKVLFSYTASASVTLAVLFGGQTVCTTTQTTTQDWNYEFEIFNRNSLTQQAAYSSSSSYSQSTANGLDNLTVDTTVDQYLQFVVTLSSANNSAAVEYFRVERVDA